MPPLAVFVESSEGACFLVDAYRRAIHPACDRALSEPDGIATDPAKLAAWQSKHRWAPNQLRHAAATEIRPSLPDVVDAADFTVWRDHLSQSFTLTNENPAAATPGVVDAEDYAFWKTHFGEIAGGGPGSGANAAVPEPTSRVLFMTGVLVMFVCRRVAVS